MSQLGRWVTSALCGLVALHLLGCKSLDPNPELKDPIYKDLSTIQKEFERKLKDEEKTQEENNKELAGALNNMDLKVARKKISNSSRLITHYRQMAAYYKIRAEHRRVDGRRAYRVAFAAGNEWPNPAEYQAYLVNKRLRAAPQNWSVRVPRLTERYVAQAPEPVEEKGGK